MKLKRKTRRWLKHLIKRIVGTPVYTAKYELIRGMRVTGDLGFIETPTLSLEDRFLMGLDLNGKTVIDAGAHIGLMALFFARQVGPGGRVITFEPNPESFAFVKRNIELNHLDNVTAINAALGPVSGTAGLVFEVGESAEGSMDSTQQSKMALDRQMKMVTVQIMALDDFMSGYPFPVDFIKVDVEGYEVKALMGMRETLERFRPALLIELHGRGPERLERLEQVRMLLCCHEITDISTGQAAGDNVGKFIYCQSKKRQLR